MLIKKLDKEFKFMAAEPVFSGTEISNNIKGAKYDNILIDRIQKK